MSYDEHDLPEGWTRQMHEGTPFYVDTRANPPRSIWVHPYEDEQFLRENPGVRPGGARRPSVSPQPSSGGDRGLFGSSHNFQPPPMGQHPKHGKAALVEKLIKKVMHSKSGQHQQQQYYPPSQGMSSYYGRPQHGGMGGSPFGGGGPGMGMGMGMGHGPGHHGHQGFGGGGMGGGGPMFVQQGRPHRRMGGGMGGMGMPLMGGMAGGLLLGEMLDGPDHYGGGFGGGDYGGGGGDWGGGGGGDFGGGGGGFGGGDFGGGGGGGF